MHVLGEDGYQVVDRSTWLPELDLALICRLLLLDSTIDAMKQIRAAARDE